jgi:uncharacterized protein
MTSERFYPAALPPFAHEPRRDRFVIDVKSDGSGEGVRSLVDFEAGDVLFSFTGFFTGEITQFSLQVRPGLHLHDPYFMGKVLHSCAPNAVVDMEERTFTAIRPIEKGAFVTMDYAQTEDVLYRSFVCQCGAPNCRGLVTGRLETVYSTNGVG